MRPVVVLLLLCAAGASSLDGESVVEIVEPRDGSNVRYIPDVPLWLSLSIVPPPSSSNEAGETAYCFRVRVDGELEEAPACKRNTYLSRPILPGKHTVEILRAGGGGVLAKSMFEMVSERLLDRRLFSEDGHTVKLPAFMDDYHRWFYKGTHGNDAVWRWMTYRGVWAHKSPMDMWNYQEIIFGVRPSLLVEVGVRYGGSTLYFADLMNQMYRGGAGEIGGPGTHLVLGVDIEDTFIDQEVFETPNVEVLIRPSTHEDVSNRIRALREEYPGSMFVILDGDHHKDNVMMELQIFTRLLAPGDYLVVEDTNVNGHPINLEWGPGPWEAVTEFLATNREAYDRDLDREVRFGFSQAPMGFLRRTTSEAAVRDPLWLAGPTLSNETYASCEEGRCVPLSAGE